MVNIPTLTVPDNGFTIYNSTTPTKKAIFDASGITAATTRTYTFPDANGTIALVGVANGSTNFTRLGINIGATTPVTNLEINGDFAIRESDNTSSTTPLADVSTASISNLYFTGETGAPLTTPFVVDGFADGYDGKKLHVYNKGGKSMTFANLTGTAANQINTLSGGDVTLTGSGSVDFVYDGTAQKWIMQPAMANTIVGLAAVGVNYSIQGTLYAGLTTTTNQSGAALHFNAIAGATYEIRCQILIPAVSNASEKINIGFEAGSTTATVALSMLTFSSTSSGSGFAATTFIDADYNGNQANEQSTGTLSRTQTNVILITGLIKPDVSGIIQLTDFWNSGAITDGIGINSYLSATRVQ